VDKIGVMRKKVAGRRKIDGKPKNNGELPGDVAEKKVQVSKKKEGNTCEPVAKSGVMDWIWPWPLAKRG